MTDILDLGNLLISLVPYYYLFTALKHQNLLNQLKQNGITSDAKTSFIQNQLEKHVFSIHWELRTLLYLGITAISTGLGILIYENINSFGHAILIGLLAILCIGFFLYSFKHIKPFTKQIVAASGKLEEFALIAGCLAFLSLEGYLQYQYNFFGQRYELASFIPAILFFFLAYRFDHRAVLSMAITAVASGVGVSIAPVRLWESNDFNSQKLVFTAIALGLTLILTGWLLERNSFKKHFSFTYFFLGGNLFFIAALAGLFHFDMNLVYFILIGILATLNIIYAREQNSYIFMLIGVIYGYVAFTYAIFKILPDDLDVAFGMFYFIASGAGVIVFLVKIKKLIGLKK